MAPSLEDVTCPICLSLLLEPVTLPCRHSLCLQCFQEHVNITSLVCPMCRVRISVWLRKNTKTNTLVDTKLWRTIQDHFPSQLEARLAGKDDSDEGITPCTSHHRVSEPGEVRQEYEDFLAQQTQEARKRKTKEETESIKLIQKMQEEEKKRQEEEEEQRKNTALADFLLAIKLKESDASQMKKRQKELEELCLQDEDIARQLEKVEKRSPQVSSKMSGAGKSRGTTPSKGPMDLFIGRKGVIRGHNRQSTAGILGSSDTNSTILLATPSPPRHPRESTLKRFPSSGSDSESDEPLASRIAPRGKENLARTYRGSPTRSKEASRSKSAQSSLQFSPDIDDFCVSEVPSTSRQASSDNLNSLTITHDSEDDSPDQDLSFLLKWENGQESLEALLAEQKRAEAQLQQEKQDRFIAQALQEEFNKASRVMRTRGSEDEYSLRKRKNPFPQDQEQDRPSKKRSTKKQTTLSDMLRKRDQSL